MAPGRELGEKVRRDYGKRLEIARNHYFLTVTHSRHFGGGMQLSGMTVKEDESPLTLVGRAPSTVAAGDSCKITKTYD